MKVTSEQLLDLFELKVGDKVLIKHKINNQFFEEIYEVCFSNSLFFRNGVPYLQLRHESTDLSYLLNKEYTIIRKPQLTEDEKVILRNLPVEYKGYIARYRDTHCDGFSILIACKTKPIKDNDLDVWASNNDFTNLPYEHLFQFITWEDEEPYNIKELLYEET